MHPFCQQKFDFIWEYLRKIPTVDEYNNTLDQVEVTIITLQQGKYLTSEQTQLLTLYSKHCGFSWGNGKSKFTYIPSWDSGIVEQGFPEETTPTVYYLEFPNIDNPTGTIYTPAQKQKQTTFHRYTQHEFNNLSLYEQELNNGVQSTDGIKELFKFRQNKGFGTWL
jgi:hypothetical protein